MICANHLICCRFCATRLLYHIRFDLSRGFWKVFWIFSSSFRNRFSNRAEVLWYYITSLSICQEVFQKFFQLFSWYSVSLSFRFPLAGTSRWQPLSSWQLAHYSTSPPFCQAVFAKFFRFGVISNTVQSALTVFVHVWQFLLSFDPKTPPTLAFPPVFVWKKSPHKACYSYRRNIIMFGRGEHPSKFGGSPAGDRRSPLRISKICSAESK